MFDCDSFRVGSDIMCSFKRLVGYVFCGFCVVRVGLLVRLWDLVVLLALVVFLFVMWFNGLMVSNRCVLLLCNNAFVSLCFLLLLLEGVYCNA